MSYQNPYKWMAGFCLFHYKPTQQFKQHLHLCIYNRCLWQETPSQLHSCGWAAAAASPESQGTYKSHTKVTEIHHGQNTLNCDPTRQNKANQTIQQANSHVLHWPEPGKLLVHPGDTPPEHSPREEGEGEGLSWAAVPLPTTVPGALCCSHQPAPSVPGTLEQLLQFQVCSRNGPRGRWNLSSHEPQVGAHYSSNLKLGRIYS